MSGINPMELEKHIHMSINLADAPIEAIGAYFRSAREGVPTALVKHPTGGWFVICTAGQGPVIIWKESMGGWIERIEDLFQSVGCRDFNGLNRSVYNGTSCGAWVEAIGPGRSVERKEKQIWTVFYTLVQEDEGWKVTCSGFNHDGTPMNIHCFDAPREVLSYFHVDHNGDCSLDPKVVSNGMLPNNDDILKVSHINKMVRVRARFDVPVYKYHTGGVCVGSIVEGTEQCADPVTLYFPFYASQFWEALTGIEEQCNEIWNETHGCEKCWPEGTVDQYGNEFEPGEIGAPVNPDCGACSGEGAII